PAVFSAFRHFLHLGFGPHARHDPMTTTGTVTGPQDFPLPDEIGTPHRGHAGCSCRQHRP
ncbi:hypothetical protein HPB47_019748, partial [Ixodes persulcatus]